MKRLLSTLSFALVACLMLSGCDFLLNWLSVDHDEPEPLKSEVFYFPQEGGVLEMGMRRSYYTPVHGQFYLHGQKYVSLHSKLDTLPNGNIRMLNDTITLEWIGLQSLRITVAPNPNDSARYFHAGLTVYWGGIDDHYLIDIRQDGLKQAAPRKSD